MLCAFVIIFSGTAFGQTPTPVKEKPPPVINLPLGGDGDITTPPSSNTRPTPKPKSVPASPERPAPPKSDVQKARDTLRERIEKHEKRLAELKTPAPPATTAPTTTIPDAQSALKELEKRYEEINGEYTLADRELTGQIASQIEQLKELKNKLKEMSPDGKAPVRDYEKLTAYNQLNEQIDDLKKQITEASRKLQSDRFEQLLAARKALDAVRRQIERSSGISGDLLDPSAFAEGMRELERRVLERTVADLKALQTELDGRGPSKPGTLELRAGGGVFVLAAALNKAFREIDLVGAEKIPANIRDKKTFNGPLGEQQLADPVKEAERRVNQAKEELDRSLASIARSEVDVKAAQEIELGEREAALRKEAEKLFPRDRARQDAWINREMVPDRVQAVKKRSDRVSALKQQRLDATKEAQAVYGQRVKERDEMRAAAEAKAGKK